MRVLLVEDNDGDADLVAEALGEVRGVDLDVTRVDRLDAAMQRLRGERFDVVLLDLTLPDSSGLDGIRRVREIAPAAPIVVLTGLSDAVAGTKAIQHGAQDYLQKGDVRGTELFRALRYASERAQYADRARILADVSVAVGNVREPAAILTAMHGALHEFADWCAHDGGPAPGEHDPRPREPRRSRLVAAVSSRSPGDPDEDRLAELARRGLDSAILVPFEVKGWRRGVLVFGRGAAAVPYGPADLVLADEIARRAIAAVEYAELLAVAERERERAEVAGRARDEFLATLSHELRTPLNAILGWTVLLRSGTVAPNKHEQALETIERNARSQVRLIEDVLEVSRIITGKMLLKLGAVDLSLVLAAALETMRPAAEAKGIELVSSVDGAIGMVQGDADRLLQVFWNLLSNAVKFTGQGGRVSVRLVRTASSVEAWVTDTGQGIVAEFLPHVFERFRQADASATRAHGGLGLGLAIARHLVELQGGTLVVRSAGAGQGSTFVMSFPSSADRRSVRSEPPRAAPIETLVHVAKPPSTLSGLTVLVVDDDDDTRALMGFMLEANGASVRLAPSAAAGLAVLRVERPDVLVSDIGMAGASGYDLIKSVRGLGPLEGGATPAVAVTAYARLDDRAQALKAGFDQHLSKPIIPDELVAMVAALGLRARATA